VTKKFQSNSKTKKIVPKKKKRKSTKVARFPGIVFSEIFILGNNRVQPSEKYSRILFFSFFFPLLSSLSCSQIWLIPLVDIANVATSQSWTKEKPGLIVA
jgi:hypothetical protein